MAKKTEVPITGDVLAWAITEGGWTTSSFAKAIAVPEDELRSWIRERSRPGKTEFRRLAERLRRPTALFFRSTAPSATTPPALREARGPRKTLVEPPERLYIRWASQLQRVVAFVLGKTNPAPPSIPEPDAEDPHVAADAFRSWLGISLDQQIGWTSPRRAFLAWKAALEEKGLLVLQFQMGESGLRGFSLWNEWAPIVALNNSTDLDYVRTFTMFHECGHILWRDQSACRGFVEAGGRMTRERWCELFAAAVLLPRRPVSDTVERLAREDSELDHINLTRIVSRAFKVSLRATALRLIDLGYAEPTLYRDIDQIARPSRKKAERHGGRPTVEQRVTELGTRVPRVLLGATEKGILGPLDAADYLRVPHTLLSELGEAAASG